MEALCTAAERRLGTWAPLALGSCGGRLRVAINGVSGGPVFALANEVTHCGRICLGRRKINLSTVFAGQNVGVKEVSDKIWLVTFMHYDLGFFDHETCRLESADNPFAAKVLPMSPV